MTRYIALVLAALCVAPALADDNTGSVEGTLLDEVTGKPAAHVPVVLDGNHGLLQSQTDGNGHFIFLTVLPGRYAVESTGTKRVRLRLGSTPAYCNPEAEIGVSAGLAWHLPVLAYGEQPADVYQTCTQVQDLHQFTTAGTTASLYIINE